VTGGSCRVIAVPDELVQEPEDPKKALPPSLYAQIMAMTTGVRKGPEDLALYADTLSQGQLRALRFRTDQASGRIRCPKKTVFHTVLNAVGPDDQPLLRSLLMVACGMHLHFHRGGGRGALNLIRQSLMILADLRPEASGVATGELYDALEAYLQDLQDRKKPGANFFDRWLAPRIRISKA
jgi:hypothetical protein